MAKKPLTQQIEAIVITGPMREDISVILEYYRLTECIAQRLLRDIRSFSKKQH